MAAIDQIVNVTITQETAAVAQASFSIPLIIGPTVPTTGIVNAYTDPASMLSNGYTTSSPEYIYALEMFEQDLTPTEFYVGKRTAAAAQVDTLSVNTLTSGHVYQFTLNGVLISYTAQSGDTQVNVLQGLNAAITTAFASSTNPITGAVTGSGSGALLTLTSAVAGQGVSYTLIDADLTHALVTSNNGIVNDLMNIIAQNNLWYGIVLCSNADNDILQLAAYVETLKKIFICASADSAIATSATTDILSVMKGKSYKRTALIWSPGSFNLGIDAAWMGGQLPFTPGSNNWAFNNLSGISPDSITDSQASILIGDPIAQIAGKNGNIFRIVGGQNITQMGTMAGGQYIDITIGVDWLQSTIQTNVFSALTSAAKIPYTDNGTAVLISAVKAAIDQGVVNGLIDGASPITVTAPPVLSVPQSQRAARVAPTITFSCRLAGAFNAVQINGTLTV